MARMLTFLEICAGAGGQPIDLEQAEFEHLALLKLMNMRVIHLELITNRLCGMLCLVI